MRRYLLSIVAMVLFLPMFGFAADVRTVEVIGKEETPKNLYLGGQDPIVNANVLGDLVVAGEDVTINGNVEQGVLAVGSTLTLNGNVGGNVRVAGGNVKIEGRVDGDLIIFAGDVALGTESIIGGDVIIFSGTVTHRGMILGSLKHSFSGDAVLAGGVTGDVEFSRVGNLTLESTAIIGGDLNYSSQTQGNIANEAKIGGNVNYIEVAVDSGRTNVSNSLGSLLFGALMAFVTLFIFVHFAPKFTNKLLNTATMNPMSKMGLGFLALIVGPLAMLALGITIFGLGIVGYFFLAYVTMFALASSFTALLVGSFAWKYFRKEEMLVANWKTAAIGVLLVVLGKIIPIFGWVALFLVFLIVFGSLVVQSYDYLKAQRA